MLATIIVDTGGILPLILGVAVIGVIVWALVTYVPMQQGFKTCIYVLAIIAVVYVLCRAFGIFVS